MGALAAAAALTKHANVKVGMRSDLVHSYVLTPCFTPGLCESDLRIP